MGIDDQAALTILGRTPQPHRRIDLRWTDLTGGEFGRGDFTKALFLGANLAETSLRFAEYPGANFIRSNLVHADLDGATIDNGTFLVGARRAPDDEPIPGWVLDENGRWRRDASGS